MKNIVIIGGGFAGAYCAKRLENNFNVTLIDTKDFFEFTPGILRTIVEPEHVKKLQVLHKDYLKRTTVVIDSVEKITTKEAIAKKKYHYDYLIICSGSRYPSPIKEEEVFLAARGSHLLEAYNKVQNAKNILIVGGGLVGVELAAEFATHCQNRNITLVHSKDALIGRNERKSQTYVEKFLRKNKVNLLFNERVKKKVNGHYITEKGVKLQADIVFLCTGIKPNSEFLKGFDNAVNEDNYVKVNEYMQVSGFSNIFAPGDVNDIQVEKTAQNAVDQAMIAVQNVYQLEKGKQPVRYNAHKTPLCISLGKYCGVLEWKGIVVTGMLPAFVKWFIETTEMWKLKH